MSDKSVDFVNRLIPALPALQAEWERAEEQLADDPEVLLIRIAFDVVHRYLTGGPAEAAQLQAAFDLLEAEHGRDAEIDELISDGFVRYLPELGRPGEEVLAMLGPKLRAERDRKQREDKVKVPESTIAFVHRMVRSVPWLWVRLREHLDDHYGELLPHVFIGSIVFEIVDRYVSAAPDAVVPPDVQAVADFLEAEYGRDDGVDNVIAVSFVENMPFPDEPGAGIVNLFGPKLTAELHQQRG